MYGKVYFPTENDNGIYFWIMLYEIIRQAYLNAVLKYLTKNSVFFIIA